MKVIQSEIKEIHNLIKRKQKGKRVKFFLKMVVFTKENGNKIINEMDLENTLGQMVLFMKDIGKITCQMVMVS